MEKKFIALGSEQPGAEADTETGQKKNPAFLQMVNILSFLQRRNFYELFVLRRLCDVCHPDLFSEVILSLSSRKNLY